MLCRSTSRLSLVRFTKAAASRTPAQMVVKVKTIPFVPRQYSDSLEASSDSPRRREKTGGHERSPNRSRCTHITGTYDYRSVQTTDLDVSRTRRDSLRMNSYSRSLAVLLRVVMRRTP